MTLRIINTLSKNGQKMGKNNARTIEINGRSGKRIKNEKITARDMDQEETEEEQAGKELWFESIKMYRTRTDSISLHTVEVLN